MTGACGGCGAGLTAMQTLHRNLLCSSSMWRIRLLLEGNTLSAAGSQMLQVLPVRASSSELSGRRLLARPATGRLSTNTPRTQDRLVHMWCMSRCRLVQSGTPSGRQGVMTTSFSSALQSGQAILS